MANTSPASGISLMEALIALFVVALLATAGGIMLTQSLRGTRLVEDRGSSARELQTALSMIRDDLVSFVDRPSRTESASDTPARFEGRAVAGDGRIVLFIRNGWANPAAMLRGDLQKVEYAFEDGTLVRRSWSAPDTAPGTAVSEQVLLTGLSGITVRYGLEQAWQSEWIVPAGVPEAPLPDKLELQLMFEDEDMLTARFRIGLRG